MTTSVVLPVFRTRDCIRPLHTRLVAMFEAMGEPFELVYVDDACPEGSAIELAGLAAGEPRVVVVSNERNLGQQRAVLRGLAVCRGDRVVVMDADLQDPPETIPSLLHALADGGGAVFAGRRGPYQSRGRLVTSLVFKRSLALLAGVPADAGIFVAMDRRAVERALALQWRWPFLVAMIGCADVPMRSLPVARSPRPHGRSAYTGSLRLRTAILALLSTALERAKPLRYQVLLGAALFIAYWLIAVLAGPGFTDESWFLQVVARVRAGERLYGDVFFGATPLSIWVAAAASLTLGVELLAVKAVTALALATSTVVAVRVTHRIVPGWPALAAGVAVFASAPVQVAPYGPLATALAMLAFDATVQRSPRPGWIGLLAGACFAAKQNVGLLLCPAVVCLLAGRLGRRQWGVAAAAAIVGALAPLVPVATSGSFPSFLEYGFLGKGTYLRDGVSFAALDLPALARVAGGDTGEFGQRAYLTLLLLASPLAVVRLLRTRRLDVTVMAFYGLLAALPRVDAVHVGYIAPILVPPLVAAAAAGLRPRRSRLAGALVLAVAGVVALVKGEETFRHWRGGADLPWPHFAAMRAPRAAAADFGRAVGELRDCAGSRATLVLGPDAGAFYLATGLRNPTPFDYGITTAFGRRGHRRIADELASGQLAGVCLDRALQRSPLHARHVETLARERFGAPQAIGRWLRYAVSRPPPAR